MSNSKTYRLIDCGDERRLEEFAGIICDRPAPMALWPKKLDAQEWSQATVTYDRNTKTWQGNLPKEWQISFENIIFNLETSSQGQIGVFPEQLENWKWLEQTIRSISKQPLNILNGFAHTGGSTMSCALAGAKVCHLDAAKSAVNRARENASSAGISDDRIRWIVDDAIKFMQREVRRGNKYDGIILDPPAFGRLGKKVWKLEKHLPELLELSANLLSEKPSFYLLTCHPHGWNKHELIDTVNKLFKPKLKNLNIMTEDYGNLSIPSQQGNALPLGFYARLTF